MASESIDADLTETEKNLLSSESLDVEVTEMEKDPFKVRQGHAAYCTRLNNKILSLIQEKGNEDEVMKVRNQLLNQVRKYFDCHEKCLDLVDKEKYAELADHHKTFLNAYDEVIKQVNNYLHAALPEIVPKPKSSKKANSVVSHSSSRLSTKLAESKVRRELAELKLKQAKEKLAFEAEAESKKAEAERKKAEAEREAEKQKADLDRQLEVKEAEFELQQSTLEADLWERLEIESSGAEREDVTQLKQVTDIQPPTDDNSQLLKDKQENDADNTRGPPLLAHFNQPATSPIHQSNDNTGEAQPQQRRASSVASAGLAPVTANQAALPQLNPSASSFVPVSSHQAATNVNQAYATGVYTKRAPSVARRHPTPRPRPPPRQYSMRGNQHQQPHQPSPQQFYQPYPSYVASPGVYYPPTYAAPMPASLPKPKIPEFDGDPKQYTAFISAFSSTITARAGAPRECLTYLIQHCSGAARSLIEDCVLLPSDQGFGEALELLKKEFGRDHIIASAYIKDLIHGKPIQPNDVDALVELSRVMRKCQLVLSHLNYSSDLDASGTRKAIIERLPDHIRARWVDKATEIHESGRSPKFADLFEFVRAKAASAGSEEGREFAESKSRRYQTRVSATKQYAPRVTTLAAETRSTDSSGASGKPACAVCQMSNHTIESCFKFGKLSLEERIEFIKSNKLCFRCLQSGHFATDCVARCSKCDRRHHELIHDDKRTSVTSIEPQGKPPLKDVTSACTMAEELEGVDDIVINCVSLKTRVCLGLLPVNVKGNGLFVRTYAVVDPGSQSSLLRRSIYDKLRVDGEATSYRVKSVGGITPIANEYVAPIEVCSADWKSTVHLKALTMKEVPVSRDTGAKAEEIKRWQHLKDITVPDISPQEVGLLIGADCAEMLWTLDERRGEVDEPVARKTRLGWIVQGPIEKKQTEAKDSVKEKIQDNKNDEVANMYEVNLLKVDPLEEMLQQQWNADFKDLASDQREEMSQEDKRALDIMKNSLSMVDGKYTLSIPWKSNPENLPDNRKLAETRMNYLKKKFERDEDMYQQYKKTVDKYISDGHARQLTEKEIEEKTPQWFLPHHPVFKRSNPTKCRVVFDCAAKYSGVCLNDVILQGPNLLNNLNKDSAANRSLLPRMSKQCSISVLFLRQIKGFCDFCGGPTAITRKTRMCSQCLFISLEQNQAQAWRTLS